MKKLLCMLLALTMLFALCACGGKTETKGDPATDSIDTDAGEEILLARWNEVRVAGAPGELAFYDAPVNASWELRRPGDGSVYGCVRVAPSDTFEVSYILDRPDMGGFRSAADVSIYSAEDLYNIFEARTFISERDYEMARKNGLLAGVDGSCGLLIGAGDASLAQKYRVREEPALHKILDLLGDLAFVRPALPKVRVEIVNGGHAAHRQILEKVINYAIRF